jgi:FdhE protein
VADWDQRIARARKLAVEHPSATDILAFYAALAEYQRSLASRHAAVRRVDGSFADAVDIETASAAVPRFLKWLRGAAPARLAEAAADANRVEPAVWRERMRQYLTQDVADLGDSGVIAGDDSLDFIVEALLQPFAEAVAIGRRGEDRGSRQPGAHASRCPVCGCRPGVAVLYEEGQGAKRMLVCPLCFTEWDYLRLVCPSCDEQQFEALPVYTADAFPHARIDACDSCRHYLKTIDLTKDALAQPAVDDLATLPLDLWAREHGYQRLRHNLLRL